MSHDFLKDPTFTPAIGKQPISDESTCKLPPNGWRCTRGPGHSGPCAALPESPNDRDTLPEAIDPEPEKLRVLSPEEQTVILLQIQTEVTEGLSLMRNALNTALAIYEEHKRDQVKLVNIISRVEILEQWRAGFATSKQT